ncbi:hypothetical protein BQ8482_380295 [Mesorhizobium delmotii]|uniref:Uncharacterized protein n=1 Tax=Mesorhizobium delmotii TaxID=1631247 RepID=A0A2P9ASJ1_9HYPH|nr:hypothetical protein BQ8482_380295 [Mesorhizobium delmotii]
MPGVHGVLPGEPPAGQGYDGSGQAFGRGEGAEGLAAELASHTSMRSTSGKSAPERHVLR